MDFDVKIPTDSVKELPELYTWFVVRH